MTAAPGAAPAQPGPTRRSQTRAIQLVLLIYAAGFVLFWPSAILVSDEAAYVGSAWAFAHGQTTQEERDGLTGEVRHVLPGRYPPGTAALQAPLVLALGFRGAPLVSLLGYLLTGLLLLRWLQREGRSPLFALVFLGFLPALVLGRVAMSDLPSALIVAGSQWLVFESRERDESGRQKGVPAAPAVFFAGLLGGASLLFRETNALLVIPLLVGALLRRGRRPLPLLAGGLLGAGLRLFGSWAAFGDPLFTKDHGYGWSLAWAIDHLPLYLGVLLVLAPLGLFGALAYRGPRRAEIIVTALGSFGFFLAYGYSGEESGPLKQLVLGPRFFIPLVPLLSIALAEALPRLWSARGRPGGERLASALGSLWTLAVLGAALAVHPVLDHYGRGQGELAEALVAATSGRGAVVLDGVETGKYLNAWDEPRATVELSSLPPAELGRLVARDGVAFVALLDRGDSAFHRERSAGGEQWRAEAAARCELLVAHDGLHGSVRLRVFRVEQCR